MSEHDQQSPTPEPVEPVLHAASADASDTAAPVPPKIPPAASTKPGSSRAPLYLATLVVLAGFGGLLYHDLEQQRLIATLAGEYDQLQSAGSGIDEQLTTLNSARQGLEQSQREQLLASQKAQAAQTEQLDALENELVALRLRVNDSSAGADGSWRLLEAESLLRLAQQRLILGREVRAALGLTQAADDLLRQVSDSAVFPVREALALDLAALRAVQEVDVPGLHARLGSVIDRVGQLTLQPVGETPAFRVEQTQEQAAVATEPNWWDGALDSLGKYFVLTRQADARIPELTAEQTWVLKEQLKLRLEQARVALLRGQPELYTTALDETRSGIEQLLQGEGKAAVLSELNALRAAPIQTSVPPASQGLDALQRLQPQPGITP